MLIKFCNADGGDILQEKESDDIKHILSSITRIGTEVNLYFGKDNFLIREGKYYIKSGDGLYVITYGSTRDFYDQNFFDTIVKTFKITIQCRGC